MFFNDFLYILYIYKNWNKTKMKKNMDQICNNSNSISFNQPLIVFENLLESFNYQEYANISYHQPKKHHK
jgi:hypothetical protein